MEIGSRDTRKRLPELLRRVREEGSSFIITRRGQPVAALVPVAAVPGAEAGDALLHFPRIVGEREEEWLAERLR